LEKRGAVRALLQSESGQLQAGDPALGAAYEPAHLFCRERRGEHLVQEVVRLDLSKTQIVSADLSQLPTDTQTCEGQVRVHPAGEDQVQMGRQMLQEEAQGFMDGRIADDLIIVHNEDNGGRTVLAAFQLMKKRGKTSDKRRRL